MTIRLVSGYTCTITNEPDEDFRKYLARRMREVSSTRAVTAYPFKGSAATPLDISLDDPEGDVVAGLSARTVRDCLYIDLLWVDVHLRGQGIGGRLMTLVEEIAVERGCCRVRICVSAGVNFLCRLGYAACGKLQPFPSGDAIYWLIKDLPQPVSAVERYERKGPA
jgi:GNAT superfamily N-acetyltransferase